MSKYLIDTDVLIEVLRGNQKTRSYLEALHQKRSIFFYSPVSKAEIFHGIRKGERAKTKLLFQSMHCIPIVDEVGEKSGLYLKKYHQSHDLQLGDALIASSAWFSNTVLLTFNRKHYPMKEITVTIALR